MSDITPEEAASAMVNKDGSADMDTDPIPEPDADAGAGAGDDLDEIPGPDMPDESGGSIIGRLLSSEPSPSLNEVENPWDPDAGAETRVYRGVQKMADIEGMPAIFDLLIGAVEIAHKHDLLDESDRPADGGSTGSDGRGNADTNRSAPPSVGGEINE